MDINVHSSASPAKSSSPNAGNLKHALEGMHIQFPKFKHDHPPIVNVNEVADEKMTIGQRVADWVAAGMGSWRFIIGQTAILGAWAFLNSVGWWPWKWDIYPFIAMNLLLSCQAAYAAPIIMMSQNRQSQKDRLTAENDYKTDVKGEEEICHIMEHLDHQDTLIIQMVQHVEVQNERLNRLDTATLEIVQRLQAQNQRMEEQHKEMLSFLGQLDPGLAAQAAKKLEQPTGEQAAE
jgi:uncharacterized membrane protein